MKLVHFWRCLFAEFSHLILVYNFVSYLSIDKYCKEIPFSICEHYIKCCTQETHSSHKFNGFARILDAFWIWSCKLCLHTSGFSCLPSTHTHTQLSLDEPEISNRISFCFFFGNNTTCKHFYSCIANTNSQSIAVVVTFLYAGDYICDRNQLTVRKSPESEANWIFKRQENVRVASHLDGRTFKRGDSGKADESSKSLLLLLSDHYYHFHSIG